MLGPDHILLISCYELGHQPVGLAMPLAFLEQAGYRPRALDVAVERPQPEQLAAARLVGISVPMHTALRLGTHVAQRIRQLNPRAHICFFGHYALLNADYLLGELADSVLGGEYEAQLVELVQALEGRKAGEASDPARDVAPQLTRLVFPVPSRSDLPALDRYARLDHEGDLKLAGHVEASRGCLFTCTHCPIPSVYGGRLFVVPQDVVLKDIRQQVEQGARHLSFGDPDFLNGPEHSLRIVRAMRLEHPELSFDFTTKIENILKYPKAVSELATLGALFVTTAVESLSDRVLGHLNKGHTAGDVYQALAMLREAGLFMRPSLLPFTPWSGLDDYIELLDFVEAEGLSGSVDPVQFTIRLLLPPGSLLLESSAMKPFLGDLDKQSLSYVWTHPEPQMDRLQTEASRLVAELQRKNETPEQILRAIRRLAADKPALPGPPALQAPRLTESWYC